MVVWADGAAFPLFMLELNDILYFLHIPKTAGTSLATWLASHFKISEVCPILEFSALRQDPDQMRRYRFFTGHWGMKLPALVEGTRIVTWLRDPARRLLSNYNYLRNLDAKCDRC